VTDLQKKFRDDRRKDAHRQDERIQDLVTKVQELSASIAKEGQDTHKEGRRIGE